MGRAAWEELQAHWSASSSVPHRLEARGGGPLGVSPRGQLLGAEQGQTKEQGSAGEPAAAQHT